MAFWNHLDAPMCRVNPSSLGDLGLKWFEKIHLSSIGSFLLLSESVVARFVIDTKVPKDMSSILTLRKGKHEMLRNDNSRHWELYDEIEKCSKDITVVSYKLKLTLEDNFGMI